MSTGDAGPFHHRPIPRPAEPTVWIHHVRRPALVLGSTQADDDVDVESATEAGVEVCRRRSGGGIVALHPGVECWIDVIVPRESLLWDDDVGRAFDWLGRVWVDTLCSLPALAPVTDTVVAHQGPLEGAAAGRLLCFASLGPGEVTVEGRKVVGISQRRTRDAARFQSAAVGRWEPSLLLRHVRPDRLTTLGLDPTTMPVGSTRTPWPSPDELAAEFCRRLPPPLPAAGKNPSRSSTTD